MLTHSNRLFPIPVTVVFNYPVVTMTWIHLASLGSHLIIFRPILFCSHTMEMARAILIAWTKQVHTLILVIIHMKWIYWEACPADKVFHIGEMLRKPFFDMEGVWTCWVVWYIYIDVCEVSRLECSCECKVSISKAAEDCYKKVPMNLWDSLLTVHPETYLPKPWQRHGYTGRWSVRSHRSLWTSSCPGY